MGVKGLTATLRAAQNNIYLLFTLTRPKDSQKPFNEKSSNLDNFSESELRFARKMFNNSQVDEP